MSAYTCTLCGEVMAAEFAHLHSLVADVEQRLIDIFAELYPEWCTEDGVCSNCVDLHRAYRETLIRPLRLKQRTPQGDVSSWVIPCTLCGYEILKEEFLFHQRVEEALFIRILIHNLEWVGDDGECPPCFTYMAKILAAVIDDDSALSNEAA